jgi:hypothetical protein
MPGRTIVGNLGLHFVVNKMPLFEQSTHISHDSGLKSAHFHLKRLNNVNHLFDRLGGESEARFRAA